MIDRLARTKMAELSRQLAIGRITNYQFEEALLRNKEVGLHEVFFNGLWPLYDDLQEHKLSDKRALTKEGREWVARIILFLKSGQPYRYPRTTGIRLLPVLLPVMLFSMLTLGWFGRKWRRMLWRKGDESVWPFFSVEEYQQALNRPTYLHGVQQGIGADAVTSESSNSV